ncbi:uncharacterized protein K452DRAFT_305107 [Aplosporella prunicola CBS 121167]|uniref:Uncharacterized protein n=1 Tax=Aplosporella prunicola CBS 121167 TaxID=1176127 RepID=A0A6A6BQU0_9PEZI|nr:uncharacterized protein K452DRAFT_305107 [Aplosporella prunicola CBS 121167]KAF2146128.1 hypothetical protein K452DRAFT_305107 [Aplosporella prunicola CBS 121167]
MRRALFHAPRLLPLQSRFLHRASDEPTIFALSTAAGRAAIAVIRISGPACVGIYRALCPTKPLPKPRNAALRTLYSPGQSQSPDSVLDSALVLFFPSPKTVTGEDLLELHVHGGPAIVKAVLAAVSRCSTATHPVRYAEQGEFTRRAFMNDRLDLTQVEALGDSLTATTEQQRRLSVRGTNSGLSKRYESWCQQLLYARGELEALIDFSEDQHFDESPAMLASSVAEQVRRLKQQVEAHATNAVRGELLRNGISIALLGEPNAGKSSLLNRVVGREAAIVSQVAGTTRDVVETGIDLSGWYCRLGDTAGLRKSSEKDSATSDPNIVGLVEQEGIRRAKERAMNADVVVVVFCIEPADNGGTPTFSMSSEVVETAKEVILLGGHVIAVVNKADVIPVEDSDRLQEEWFAAVQKELEISPKRIHFISCKDVDSERTNPDPGNIQAFLGRLTEVFEEMTVPFVPDIDNTEPDLSMWQESLGATERQRALLEDCSMHLGGFLAEVDNASKDVEGELDVVLAAESLRAAANCLAKITGRGEAGDVEEVLGVVFEKCIMDD